MKRHPISVDLSSEQDEEKRSFELVEFISKHLDGTSSPATTRARLSLGCLYAALDHHAGLVLLLSLGIYAPGFALVRPLYEGFVRGTWLAFCATDEQISAFANNASPPPISAMLSQIEETGPFGGSSILGKAHKRNWNSLCDFAHNGVQQAMLHQSGNEITRNCEREKLEEALRYSGVVAILSATMVCAVAEQNSLAVGLLQKAPDFVTRN